MDCLHSMDCRNSHWRFPWAQFKCDFNVWRAKLDRFYEIKNQKKNFLIKIRSVNIGLAIHRQRNPKTCSIVWFVINIVSDITAVVIIKIKSSCPMNPWRLQHFPSIVIFCFCQLNRKFAGNHYLFYKLLIIP